MFRIAAMLFIFAGSALAEDMAGCQSQLVSSLCYTRDVKHWAQGPKISVQGVRDFQDRSCAPVPGPIKKDLSDIYNAFPKKLQQAFCEIKRIFIISDDVPFGARAEYFFEPTTIKLASGNLGTNFSGRPIGYVLEISEKHRFKGESSSDLFTRVLQARFGHSGPRSSTLPVAIVPEENSGHNGALEKTIVHELGHLLARAQKVTPTYFLPFSEGPWSKLSFKLESGSFQLRHARPGLQDLMTFKLLTAKDVPATLDFFRNSGFATIYGATNPQEDFAEFFMLYFYPRLTWKLGESTIFDLPRELDVNPAFRAKREIIERLLLRENPFSLENRGTVNGQIESM